MTMATEGQAHKEGQRGAGLFDACHRVPSAPDAVVAPP